MDLNAYKTPRYPWLPCLTPASMLGLAQAQCPRFEMKQIDWDASSSRYFMMGSLLIRLSDHPAHRRYKRAICFDSRTPSERDRFADLIQFLNYSKSVRAEAAREITSALASPDWRNGFLVSRWRPHGDDFGRHTAVLYALEPIARLCGLSAQLPEGPSDGGLFGFHSIFIRPLQTSQPKVVEETLRLLCPNF